MKTTAKILACALAFGAALIVPHSTSAQTADASPQVRLAASVDVIKAETAATRDQLQATLNDLNALTKQEKGDLKPTFDTYSAHVQKTHGVAEQTAARITAMQDASKECFGAWKAQI